MDILKQCQKWHEESKQHKILDALEAIPAEERTPEMDLSLIHISGMGCVADIQTQAAFTAYWAKRLEEDPDLSLIHI